MLDEEPTHGLFVDVFYTMLRVGYAALRGRDRIIAEAKQVFLKTYDAVLYQCNRGGFP